MSEVVEAVQKPEEIPAAPVVPEAPVAPAPEPPELVFVYQPTDELGRPLGGKQVIKYRTADELPQKLVEQNTLLVRKLREEKKKNLGVFDPADVPSEAPRFEEPVPFTPRQLSADERTKLSRDLLDPDKFDEASSTLFEATVGAKPEALRQTLTRLQDNNLRMLAKAEAEAFVELNPSYFACKENFESITGWMISRNLQPVRENYQRAFDTLKQQGNVLVEAPVAVAPVAPVAPTNEPVVQAPVSQPTEPPQSEARRPVAVPTGLTRNQSTDAGARSAAGDEIIYEVALTGKGGKPTGEKKTYRGLQAVDAMPSEEYKRRVYRDPNFQKKVEQLEAERARKRQTA